MGNTDKFQKLKTIILFISILLNLFCIREIIKYEPATFKNRFYFEMKQRGWLDNKVSLAELKSDSTIIFLTLGQSNAANSSNSYYSPKNNVLNYYDGKLYKAKEPLIGAGGDGGCVWTILADKMIDSGLCKKVIIIPIAVGSTNIENWAKGECNIKLRNTLDDLNRHNIKLTYVLWHHGEANNGTSKESYKENLRAILKTIREKNQTAPFFCSIASYNFLATTKPLGIDSSIQNAQKEFISENENVLRGPNTDILIYAIDRHDSQHFSQFGNFRYANLWLTAIKEHYE